MRIALFGGGNKGTVILKKLIELQQDVVGVFYFNEDRHENIWYEKIQDVAEVNGISTFYCNRSMEEFKPDVAFVVGWRYKIPKEQYSIPTKGTIVFHDSLLPKYRGFAPMNWAIINGEKQFGATTFYIADEIDSGDIIAQRANYIEVLDTAETIERAISRMYVDMLTEMLAWVLPGIEDGIVGIKPQDHSNATYTCKRIPEDGLINWSMSTVKIYNLIRGLSYPYPNAFSYIDGSKVCIGEAKLIESKDYVGGIAGRVVSIQGEWVEVLTGDGSLLIKPDCEVKSIKTTFRRVLCH